MNRNVESHFSQVPRINIPRSIFNRSSTHKTSFNAGDLIPLYVDEILPGDSVKMRTSKVIRLQTMLTPIMDNIYFDVYWFFVPNRLVWEHWQQFTGENTESAWAPTATYSIPKIKSPDDGFAVGTIADYMGIPTEVPFKVGKRMPSALPFRGYALIADTFFRDQNLTDPLNIPKGDANQEGSNGDDYVDDVANGGKPFRVAKYHDYFTSALPNVQKGDPVGFPINFNPFSGDLPVVTGANWTSDVFPMDPLPLRVAAQGVGFLPPETNFMRVVPISSGGTSANLAVDMNDSIEGGVIPSNLKVTIPDSGNINTNITINDLRLAFSLQRFLEAQARGGSRYIEHLANIFGVTSPDARLQLPEYLGGNRIPVQVHQVTNTAQAERDFLGDLGAMSLTHDVHYDFEKSFTEHGYLFCVGCMRYDHSYPQGLEKFWSRTDYTDFYIPIFANIGEQPIYKSEIFYDEAHEDDVFGYQEAWSEYRYKPNRVSGEMRPGIPNSLASWHLSDYYDTAPTLSDSWIREDKNNLDRCLAVTSSVANQAFIDVYFDATFTRPMPMYSIPMLEGHF